MIDQLTVMLVQLLNGTWLDGTWLQILSIIWIDIVLSGDNAVVIALASRGLPQRQRAWAIVLGCAAAILLRFAFAGGVTKLLLYPGVRLIGGLFLLWIAVKMLVDSQSHGHHVKPAGSLPRAVWTITVADGLMSFDNVIAIAGVAKGELGLILFGILVSIPLIICGSSLIQRLIDRLPMLIWAGAGLLGWVAGDLIADETPIRAWLVEALSSMHVGQIYANINSRGPDWLMAGACVVLVIVLGAVARKAFPRGPGASGAASS